MRSALPSPLHLVASNGAAVLTRPAEPAPLHPYAALEQVSHAVWIFDIDHARVRWANTAALVVWDADTLDELTSREMRRDMSPAVAQRLRQYQQDFERGDLRFSEQWTVYPKGQPQTLRVVFAGHRLPDGRMAMFCEGLRAETHDPESLRSVEALMHTEVMISLYDTRGLPLYRNPAARDALPAVHIEQPHHFVHAADYQTLRTDLRLHGEARLVAQVHTQAGERWHEISARKCNDAATGRAAWLVSEVDVSELKRAEAHAHYLAQHDALTGLPNRNFVLRGFEQALSRLRSQQQPAAVIFIDLDHFKNVNDSLGHAAGDHLLMQMADRLRSVVRQNDMIARLGGDEFLVLAATHDPEAEVAALCQRILSELSRSVALGPTAVRVTPSIGVSQFPRDGDDIDALMRHADLAMYRAKENGRNGVAHFTPDMTATVQHRLTLENELRNALEQGEFEVYYQPRNDALTRAIVGAEALVRWNHPVRGLVPPGVFIPLSEDCGLIHELGAFVLAQAARQQAQWAARGLALHISVNVSSRQLADPLFFSQVQNVLAQSGADPRCLELEITESVLVGHQQFTLDTLQQLSATGLRIAIDDFGTGYSNLAYLQRYPLNTLKIDRSFVLGIGSATPLAELIVSMCRMLKLHMVAEGVETEAQLQWLAERGVQEFQGYLVSPPVPVTAFEALLAAQAHRIN